MTVCFFQVGVHPLGSDLAVERVPRRAPERRQLRLVLRRRRGGPRLPHHRVTGRGRRRGPEDLKYQVWSNCQKGPALRAAIRNFYVTKKFLYLSLRF